MSQLNNPSYEERIGACYVMIDGLLLFSGIEGMINSRARETRGPWGGAVREREKVVLVQKGRNPVRELYSIL